MASTLMESLRRLHTPVWTHWFSILLLSMLATLLGVWCVSRRAAYTKRRVHVLLVLCGGVAQHIGWWSLYADLGLWCGVIGGIMFVVGGCGFDVRKCGFSFGLFIYTALGLLATGGSLYHCPTTAVVNCLVVNCPPIVDGTTDGTVECGGDVYGELSRSFFCRRGVPPILQ